MDSQAVPVFFFGSIDTLSAEERIERKRRENAEIIRWKYRFLKLDAIKPSATRDAFQIRCRNKRLIHLEREKAEKEEAQKISNASVYCREAESSRRHILRLMDEVASYDGKISATKTDINELESQIHRATVELNNSVKAVISDYPYAEALQQTRNKLRAIENRLHHVRTMEGKLHAENKKLRRKIEGMLGERKRYNQLWSGYLEQLSRNRKFLLDLTERATLAFNQGEDLCYQIEALKTWQLREKRSQVQEMVELERQIVGTQKMNTFLYKKGFQRKVAALDRMLVRKRNIFKHEQQEQIQNYSEIIFQIKKSFNLEGIQHVLCKIEKQQEKYMALFRYINLTNDKIDEANDIAFNLENEIQCLQEAEWWKKCLFARKSKRVMHRLEDFRRLTTRIQDELAGKRESLELKLAIVEHALSLVGYDYAEIINLMAGSNSSDRSRLTEISLKFVLAKIEGKVLNMLQMNIAPEFKIAHDSTIEILHTSQQCAECAESQDVNQHDERITVPLEYDQLLKNVQKRSAAPEMLYRLHTLSSCKLPRSRMLVNKRF